MADVEQKQSNPSDRDEIWLQGLLAYKAIVAGDLVSRRATAHFRRYLKITHWEARIIAWLGSFPDTRMPLKELGRRTRLDKGHLSRIVSELASRGLVERHAAGRSIGLSLSEEGLQVYRRFMELAALHEMEYTQGFDPEDLAVLRRTLDKLIVHMMEINDAEALTEPED